MDDTTEFETTRTIEFSAGTYADLAALAGLPADPGTVWARFAALPSWLTPQLLATDEARQRIFAWREAGKPDVDVADIDVAAGELLVPLIRSTLAALPPPVRWHLLRHAGVVGTGHGVDGWCYSTRPHHADAVEGRRLLIVQWRGDDVAFADALRHEVAHHVLERGPALDRLPVTTDAIRDGREDRRALLRLGAELGRLHELADRDALVEARAAALARHWGARTIAGCAAAQAAFARSRVEAEARAACATGDES